MCFNLIRWYIMTILHLKKLKVRSSNLFKVKLFESDRARIQTWLFFTPKLMSFSPCQTASQITDSFMRYWLIFPVIWKTYPRFIHFRFILILISVLDAGDILLGTQSSCMSFGPRIYLKTMYFLQLFDSIFSQTFQENRRILQEVWKRDWTRIAQSTGCSGQAE